VELLCLHGIGVLDVLEHLGREAGQPFKVEQLTRGERVADLEITVIGQPHDIARERLVQDLLFLRHEGGRRREPHRAVKPRVPVVHIPLELAGADFQKSDAGAVIGVHVRVNLEDEAAELLLVRVYRTLDGLHGTRRRGDLDEAVQQLLYTEVVQRGAEKDRRQPAREVLLTIECGVHSGNQLQVVA